VGLEAEKAKSHRVRKKDWEQGSGEEGEKGKKKKRKM
jgi:hypothetical protein